MTRIYVSSVIPAPVGKVWQRIRDFNALPGWHPMVAASKIEGGRPSDSVGCVRNFSLKDGAGLREQLLALSDPGHTFTYNILESPMPVRNYVATVKLSEITDGNRTFAEWSAEFDVPPDKEKEVVTLVTGVFQGGFDSLKGLLG
jgi:hypothetical protein